MHPTTHSWTKTLTHTSQIEGEPQEIHTTSHFIFLILHRIYTQRERPTGNYTQKHSTGIFHLHNTHIHGYIIYPPPFNIHFTHIEFHSSPAIQLSHTNLEGKGNLHTNKLTHILPQSIIIHWFHSNKYTHTLIKYTHLNWKMHTHHTHKLLHSHRQKIEEKSQQEWTVHQRDWRRESANRESNKIEGVRKKNERDRRNSERRKPASLEFSGKYFTEIGHYKPKIS